MKEKKCYECGRKFTTTTDARKCSNCKQEVQRFGKRYNQGRVDVIDMTPAQLKKMMFSRGNY